MILIVQTLLFVLASKIHEAMPVSCTVVVPSARVNSAERTVMTIPQGFPSQVTIKGNVFDIEF